MVNRSNRAVVQGNAEAPESAVKDVAKLTTPVLALIRNISSRALPVSYTHLRAHET